MTPNARGAGWLARGMLHSGGMVTSAEALTRAQETDALSRTLVELGLDAEPAHDVLAQITDASEWATLIALADGALDRRHWIGCWVGRCEAIAARLLRDAETGHVALPALLAGTASVRHACATVAEALPELAPRCEALWAACAQATHAHPTALRAGTLVDRVRRHGWRYRELAREAAALGVRDGVPAETILELVLGTAPLPLGASDDHERRHGRTGYAATAIATAVAAVAMLELSAADTFYDLGAGLGLPSCIAALTSDATCRGVEYHARYVAHAAEHARRLGLANVQFFTGDAATFDIADGNKFYLFNPFMPDVQRRVTASLLALAQSRAIRVVCLHTELASEFRTIATDGPLRLYAAGRGVTNASS
ncbi:MAG: class I SAM-dependent methyltransferase [Kofleriaceae bacterium]